jgi:hypothetical protein
MDDFDPVPPVNPFFRGLIVAVLLTLIVLAFVGMAVLAVAVLT